MLGMFYECCIVSFISCRALEVLVSYLFSYNIKEKRDAREVLRTINSVFSLL